jgi:hypothetical protein
MQPYIQQVAVATFCKYLNSHVKVDRIPLPHQRRYYHSWVSDLNKGHKCSCLFETYRAAATLLPGLWGSVLLDSYRYRRQGSLHKHRIAEGY